MATETITCEACGTRWVEKITDGPRPSKCEACRRSLKQQSVVLKPSIESQVQRLGDLPRHDELVKRDTDTADATSIFAQLDADESGQPTDATEELLVAECRTCDAVYAGEKPTGLCHRCTHSRAQGKLGGGRGHGLTRAVDAGCRCDQCLEALVRGQNIVRQRVNGETLEDIGESHGLTRERARQISMKVAPWEPWKALERESEAIQAESERVGQAALASLKRVHCEVCGRVIENAAANRRFCAGRCRDVWERLSYHTDSDRRQRRREAMARHALSDPEANDAQRRFAQRLLAGEIDHDENEFRWMVEGTTAFDTAVQAVASHWPIADRLPPSIRRQIYEHLGWDWDGDPDVPSGSESLQHADWMESSQGREYSDVLTSDFLTEAYVEEELSTAEIAEIVGCSRGTVTTALKRADIELRGTSPASPYWNMLTEEFLRERYVEQEMSGTDIAEEIGCDKSVVYAWLHRHGIQTRPGGGGRTQWSEVLTEEFLRERYVEQEMSGTDIAEEVGCNRSVVYAWLRRHDIEARDPSPNETDWDPQWLREQYIDEGRSGSDIAEELGVPAPTLYGALRRFGIRRHRK